MTSRAYNYGYGFGVGFAFDAVPSVLYHLTNRDNVKSIKRQGIKAQSDEYAREDARHPGVNFTATPSNNLGLVTERNDRVLRVKTSGLDPNKFKDQGNGWMRYMGPVPASNVRGVYKK